MFHSVVWVLSKLACPWKPCSLPLPSSVRHPLASSICIACPNSPNWYVACQLCLLKHIFARTYPTPCELMKEVSVTAYGRLTWYWWLIVQEWSVPFSTCIWTSTPPDALWSFVGVSCVPPDFSPNGPYDIGQDNSPAPQFSGSLCSRSNWSILLNDTRGRIN